MLLNLEFGRADIYKKCGVDNHVVRVYPDIFPQLTAASVSGVCVSEQREMEGENATAVPPLLHIRLCAINEDNFFPF